MVGVGVSPPALRLSGAGNHQRLLLLLLWIVDQDVVAICGALSYAELAAMLPAIDREYNFLPAVSPGLRLRRRLAVGDRRLCRPMRSPPWPSASICEAIVPGAPPLLLGLCVTWLAALVHFGSMRFGSAYHNVWTTLKLLLILGLIVAASRWVIRGRISFSPSSADLPQIISAPFAVGLVFGRVWYFGWTPPPTSSAKYADPARNMPRALFLGTCIVIVLYVCLMRSPGNHADQGKQQRQLDVAIRTGRRIFSDFSSRFVGGLICLGLFLRSAP